MTLSASKFNRIMSGSNAQMQKVYDVVPATEYWSIGQILVELRRNGRNMVHDGVAGILDSLRRSGVVQEKGGTFRRISVKPFIEEDEMDIPSNVVKAVKPVPPAPKTVVTNLGRLDDITERLSTTIETLLTLAQELESVRVGIEADMNTENAETKKLKALKDTLKHLMGDD